MRQGLLALLLLLGAACESPEERGPLIDMSEWPPPTPCRGRFWIDKGFTEQQRNDIEIAATRWNAFLGYDYFSVGPEGSCPIAIGPLRGQRYAQFEQFELIVDTEHLEAGSRTSGARFQTVIMHELGHSINLEHIPSEMGAAVMCEDEGNVAEDFTNADRAECRRKNYCK